MKERPILFSGPMVRALLDGTKTQTRRIAKGVVAVHALTGEALANIDSTGPRVPCPYGEPGDRLWVRESFADARQAAAGRILYRASGDIACRWKPSIHMPRSASRILLEIISVSVERLNDISRGDAMEEGCPFPNMAAGDDPRKWYATLWKQINGAGSWEANPWVWVVEFKRAAE